MSFYINASQTDIQGRAKGHRLIDSYAPAALLNFPKNSSAMKRKIALIGAGLSGLVTAKTLREYGHEVVVFEKENEIGGVWCPSRHYPGLTTQNTRDTYAFSDFRMPKHYSEFPTGAQMLEYLRNYVQHFQMGDCLRLGHLVESAEPENQNGQTRWRLSGRHGSAPFTETADFLVVCNGTFSEPFIPRAPGMEAFEAAGGRILHTTQVGAPEQYRGKKIVVVGYGKSACDVASSLAGLADSTAIVFRQAKWKVPKRILGINYKYFILSRFGEALTKLRYRSRAEKTIHALRLPGFILRTFQGIFTRQQKLRKAGLVPGASISDLLYGELSVESDGFFKKIIDGGIEARRGEISGYFPGGATISDGSRLPADVVVYGTGFSQNLPFLSAEIRRRFTDGDGNYHLYRNILPVQAPGLAFVGYNTSFFCNLTSEMAALWVAEYLQGNLSLPTPDAMEAQIAEHLQWRRQFRQNSLYRNASVYPFNLTYVDWLLADMGARLPFPALLSEWLLVVEPAHYAPVKQKIMARSNATRARLNNFAPVQLSADHVQDADSL